MRAQPLIGGPRRFCERQEVRRQADLVFGGLGSMTGTIITGFLWILLLEGLLRLYLPAGFETWRFVVYPLVLLLMMLLRPEGLMGRYEIPFLRQKTPRLFHRTDESVASGLYREEVAPDVGDQSASPEVAA